MLKSLFLRIWERNGDMDVLLDKEYIRTQEEKQEQIRNAVLAGYHQVQEGNTKDFDLICDRLENKYLNAKV